jgi:3-deoxy-manno-octulosonate cytidylyltransferase (CMP-KDO synthetase)
MSSGQHERIGAGGTLVIVPARPAARGRAVSALADIDGLPMVMHVWRRAREAAVGRALVASSDTGVIEAVQSFGGHALQVPADTAGTTALAAAAAREIDPDRQLDAVISVPCEYPAVGPRALQRCLEALGEPVVDIATLAAPIVSDEDKSDPGIAKAVLALTPGRTIARVTDFTRLNPPDARGTQFRHVGIYAWRRTVIENFVLLPPSLRETQLQLEQLRALDAGMRVDAALVDTAPRRVDTPADLEHVRAELATKSNIQ